MNIYQRINEVRKAISYVQKDKSVSTGGGSYRAVSHDQITALIRDHLITQGIICVPTLISSHSNPKEDGAKQFRYEATYSFDFVNADLPEEKVTIVIESHAADNADKAPGKAISYAKKYAVLKLFEIETGEDEESRYQQDDFDSAIYLDMIRGAANMDDLRTVFADALGAANNAKDKEAAKFLIKAKDVRKAELAKAVK